MLPRPRIRHRFLAIDEGLGNLLHIDEHDPAADWIVPIGHGQARDLQLAGGNAVLVSHELGFSEFDLTTGRLLRKLTRFPGTTSARRLENGHTLLAGVDLDGARGVVLLEVAPTGVVRRRVVLPGDYVRLIRQTNEGTLLLMTDTRIREVRPNGSTVRDVVVPGFSHVWKAVRRPDGNLLASAGYGAFLVEVDAAGGIVRRFGARDQVPPEVRPFFYAMFQLLPNDHVVVANWQGHGPGHGSSGVQLLEFDPQGGIVWSWSEAACISSLQGVLVLDGLDAGRLHDERGGGMTPLAVAARPDGDGAA